jgi:hypothetical protein
MFMPHPSMSSEELRERTQNVWDSFYSLRAVWERSRCTPDLRARLAFVFVSKLYRQMYANTGISTDSARRSRATFWARMLAKPTLRLFQGKPLPDLQAPRTRPAAPKPASAGLLQLQPNRPATDDKKGGQEAQPAPTNGPSSGAA